MKMLQRPAFGKEGKIKFYFKRKKPLFSKILTGLQLVGFLAISVGAVTWLVTKSERRALIPSKINQLCPVKSTDIALMGGTTNIGKTKVTLYMTGRLGHYSVKIESEMGTRKKTIKLGDSFRIEVERKTQTYVLLSAEHKGFGRPRFTFCVY